MKLQFNFDISPPPTLRQYRLGFEYSLSHFYTGIPPFSQFWDSR